MLKFPLELVWVEFPESNEAPFVVTQIVAFALRALERLSESYALSISLTVLLVLVTLVLLPETSVWCSKADTLVRRQSRETITSVGRIASEFIRLARYLRRCYYRRA